MNVRKRQRLFSTIRYHGNYCGPGWSDGAYHDSVCGYAPAIDEFDQTCKEHDCAYFKYGPHSEADHTFFRANVGKGIKRTLAGLAVVSHGNKSKMPPSRYPPTPDKNMDVIIDSMTESSYPFSEKTNIPVMNGMIHAQLGGSFSKSRLSERTFKRICTTRSGQSERAEYIGQFSGGDTVWFAHATHAYRAMLNNSARSIAKLMMVKMGISFDNWSDTIDPSLATVAMNLQYQQTAVASAVGDSIDNLIAADTYQSMAQKIFGRLAAIYASFPDAYLTELRFYKVLASTERIPLATIRMIGMKVHFFSASTLAVQNVTSSQIGTTDLDDADNIGAAPLCGKIYQFKGNSARKVGKNREPVDLVATNHVTANTGGANPVISAAFSEPVHSYQFYHCQKVRAIELAAGQIKTNYISSMATTTLNSLWKNYTQRDASEYSHGYGNMHVFCLEKKVNITSAQAIAIALNCDVQMATYVEERFNYVVNPSIGHFSIST
ncbi:MAG: putative capsid protein [Kajamanuvirus moutis]|uniref:Capsid protein n=1 Tax=Cressdnaviricota sp. TaxID=2748378 RepID=A0A345MYE1_9VIRU|nr:MAG: putative capsid protein [Cressdnaviricota sp.]